MSMPVSAGSSFSQSRSMNDNDRNRMMRDYRVEHVRDYRNPDRSLQMGELSRDGISMGHDTHLKTPVDSDDHYLTPADPPPYSETDLQYGVVDATWGKAVDGNKLNSNKGNKQQQFKRSDSGIGDSESEPGSAGIPSLTSSNFATTGSVLPTHYEEIEHVSDSHLPQPHRSQRDKMHLHHSVSAPGALRHQLSNTQPGYCEAIPIADEAMAETVTAPMLETHSSTYGHTYSSLTPEGMPKSTAKSRTKGCVCISVFVLLSLVISLGTLAVGIYVFIISQAALADQTERLNRLQEANEHLQIENLLLRNGSLTPVNLTSLVKLIQSNQSSLREEVSGLKAVLANISIKQGVRGQRGPQGLPGVFNFSLCLYETRSMSGPGKAGDPATTAPLPLNPEKYFVTFAYCTFENAENAMLEATTNTTDAQYICKCWGQNRNGQNGQARCTSHVWMCPRGS